ncbi:MAG: hypothetical protein ACI3VJ_01330 [Hominicoprocola sp.]
MYNRYLRNDDGVYKRIPMQESPPPQNGSPQRSHQPHQPHQPHPPQGSGSSRKVQEGEQFLQRMLSKLKLQDVDTADILLLLILFFLFEEKADDELLIALGLLLIL